MSEARESSHLLTSRQVQSFGAAEGLVLLSLLFRHFLEPGLRRVMNLPREEGSMLELFF